MRSRLLLSESLVVVVSFFLHDFLQMPSSMMCARWLSGKEKKSPSFFNSNALILEGCIGQLWAFSVEAASTCNPNGLAEHSDAYYWQYYAMRNAINPQQINQQGDRDLKSEFFKDKSCRHASSPGFRQQTCVQPRATNVQQSQTQSMLNVEIILWICQR